MKHPQQTAKIIMFRNIFNILKIPFEVGVKLWKCFVARRNIYLRIFPMRILNQNITIINNIGNLEKFSFIGRDAIFPRIGFSFIIPLKSKNLNDLSCFLIAQK